MKFTSLELARCIGVILLFLLHVSLASADEPTNEDSINEDSINDDSTNHDSSNKAAPPPPSLLKSLPPLPTPKWVKTMWEKKPWNKIHLPQTPWTEKGEFSTTLSFEMQRFFESGADQPAQHSQHNKSASWQSEFYIQSASGQDSYTITPFYRLDQMDNQRTHGDLREFSWNHLDDGWTSTVGITRVTWGIMEFSKLVDIINQKDLFEGTGTEKMGQPLASLAFDHHGLIGELYALFGFRERSFPGEQGRLRYPFIIDEGNAQFEKGALENVDLAGRFKMSILSFDIALSHFYGMNRNPYFAFNFDFNEAKLIPVYEKINQSGIELQKIWGKTVLKLEAIHQMGDLEAFYATAIGLEYTFGAIASTNIDVTLISELSHDTREFDYRSFLDHDLFLGSRIAFNDDSDTTAIIGVLLDEQAQEGLLLFSLDRFFNDNFRLRINGSLFQVKKRTIQNDQLDNSLIAAFDAINRGDLPVDISILVAIRDSFQDFHFSTRDFNGLLGFLEELGQGNVVDLSPQKISEVALDLAKVTDGTQKLALFEKDSFFRIELQYYF